jgi:hypothetical protein
MKASQSEENVLRAAGYAYEYPGFWAKSDPSRTLTISDGESMNGLMWEVQVMSADGSECIGSSPAGFGSAEEAARWAETA